MAKKKEAAEGAEGEETKGGKGGKLKLLAMVLPTVLLIAGGVYFFVLAPRSSAAATPKASATSTADGSGDSSGSGDSTDPSPSSTYQPGKVVLVDPVTVNLANGHFLKVGVGLQETVDVTEDVSPAAAIDALITEFSGKTVDQLSTQSGRDTAKKELTKKISKAYEDKVYLIYYNSFVMN